MNSAQMLLKRHFAEKEQTQEDKLRATVSALSKENASLKEENVVLSSKVVSLTEKIAELEKSTKDIDNKEDVLSVAASEISTNSDKDVKVVVEELKPKRGRPRKE